MTKREIEKILSDIKNHPNCGEFDDLAKSMIIDFVSWIDNELKC
ncbi:MAG: hypothetical protein ACOC80_11590 [Petrotogales bacterium]